MSVADKSDDKQVIYLVGPSRGGKDGDRRTVDKATAERLVGSGVARYPANSGK